MSAYAFEPTGWMDRHYFCSNSIYGKNEAPWVSILVDASTTSPVNVGPTMEDEGLHVHTPDRGNNACCDPFIVQGLRSTQIRSGANSATQGSSAAAILAPTTPNRKRKRSMTFRSGQSGTVVRKGQMWPRALLRRYSGNGRQT